MIRLINSMHSISAGPIMEMRSPIEPAFENWASCGNDRRPVSFWHNMHLAGLISTVHHLIFMADVKRQ